jgi:hypothetical protein
MVNILILLCLGMVALALLLMLVFGARGLTYGKMKPMAMVAVIAPVALLAVMGTVLGDWPRAAIVTLAITLVVTALAMLLSSLKGLFN